jgi:hypothetical protein
MRQSFRVLILLALAGGSALPACAQQPAKGDDPSLVEVRLADGSAVRMTLVQTHIDVTTRYGKLSVPVSDIKRIDFGFRYPDGAQEKIDDGVAKLGAANYKQRETAAADLLGFRELSYPALKRALKSTDLEIAKRADELIKKIEEKVPAERLRINENDQVQTNEFTIAGKIESSTLKARSPYFGEVQVQLAEARNLRALRSFGDAEVSVEARFASHTDWMETEIEINGDDPIEIKASGMMFLRQGGQGYESGPSGNQNYRDGMNAPGQLFARVGKSGKLITVNEKFKGTTGETGRLYFRVHPGPWANMMTGSYAVKVVTGPGAEGRTATPTPKVNDKDAVTFPRLKK